MYFDLHLCVQCFIVIETCQGTNKSIVNDIGISCGTMKIKLFQYINYQKKHQKYNKRTNHLFHLKLISSFLK